jgi:hypothetical protein
MYPIRDEDVSFISADIRKRGIELDELHDVLLDHICCLIENEYDGLSDFKVFYEQIIQRFYTNNLQEIEEETYLLLVFKNHHTMKKMTNFSGLFAASSLSTGIIFKYLHWPGAALFIVIGIMAAALFFLPLQLFLRLKTRPAMRTIFQLACGTLLAMLLSLHILFRVFHWPGAALLFYGSLSLCLLFIPIYFFTGYKKNELRQTTIVTTLLMVLGCGLIFTLMRTPSASLLLKEHQTIFFKYSEKTKVAQGRIPVDSATAMLSASCEALKTSILHYQPLEVIQGRVYREEVALETLLKQHEELITQISQLSNALKQYNDKCSVPEYRIYSETDFKEMLEKSSTFSALAILNQMQLLLYQNPKLQLLTSESQQAGILQPL